MYLTFFWQVMCFSCVSWSDKVRFQGLHVDDSLNECFLCYLRNHHLDIIEKIKIKIRVAFKFFQIMKDKLFPFLYLDRYYVSVNGPDFEVFMFAGFLPAHVLFEKIEFVSIRCHVINLLTILLLQWGLIYFDSS